MTDSIDARVDLNANAFLETRDRDLRRQWTRQLNAQFGRAKAEYFTSEHMSEAEMLERCVFVIAREEVVIMPPEWANGGGKRLRSYPIKHFRTLNMGNMVDHPTRTNRQGEAVQINAADAWLSNPNKKCVEDVMTCIGRERMTTTPNGEVVVNLWTPFDREKSDTDISIFHDHMRYLIPKEDERERFLDWLAHCEQRPEELPHHGWLMWTEQFGIGRNWLSSLLSRVWQGETAPSLDLIGLLNGSFNNAISQRRCAIIDEIHMGSNVSIHTMAARLRQMMTEEIRVINPKYGKMHAEYNSVRWLVFSNHDDALPIPADDRRFEVVKNPTTPRSEADYDKLYKTLNDIDFIASVGWFLATRDISRFNPGRRPALTQSKLDIIDATTPQLDKDAADVLKSWKDAGLLLFCVSDLLKSCEASDRQTAAFTHTLKRLKVIKMGDRKKVHGRLERLFAIDRECYEQLLDAKTYQAALARILSERGSGGHFCFDDHSAGGF